MLEPPTDGETMACTHETEAPSTAAQGGCYQCRQPHDVIVFDAVIEGEGVLVICTACILDAAQAARAGRARIKKAEKAEARAAASA